MCFFFRRKTKTTEENDSRLKQPLISATTSPVTNQAFHEKNESTIFPFLIGKTFNIVQQYFAKALLSRSFTHSNIAYLIERTIKLELEIRKQNNPRQHTITCIVINVTYCCKRKNENPTLKSTFQQTLPCKLTLKNKLDTISPEVLIREITNLLKLYPPATDLYLANLFNRQHRRTSQPRSSLAINSSPKQNTGHKQNSALSAGGGI